jgi:uncharacterized OB-fold protein
LNAEAAATRRSPIRENLFVEGDEHPRLLGSRCRETGQVFFPREAMNPATMRSGTLDDHAFDGAGELVAWTVVARGLPGFDSPYALAVVRLDAGPSFIAQLQDWQGRALHPRQRVELVIDKIKAEKDGTIVVGPKFRPVEA